MKSELWKVLLVFSSEMVISTSAFEDGENRKIQIYIFVGYLVRA